jgi:3-hydroxybutyrate dehydrogenase
VALITGAASGIGEALAYGFAAQGAKVAIADLAEADSVDVARKIAAQTSADTLGLAIDVTAERAVEEGVAQVIAHFGTIDILISNAGIQWISPVHELTYEDWKRVLAVHLDGAFLTTRACLSHMYASGRGGSIIYMGSVHSKTASLFKAPYITAKHGVIGLCRSIAKEGARFGVRANAICPGFVRTQLVEKQIPEQAKALNLSEEQVIQQIMLNHTADGQFTTLDEITRCALFLASGDSLALTGQSLLVSHGWVME